MSLKEFLDRENLTAAELGRIANINKASISNHLKYEATQGEKGKPLGLDLSLRAVEAFKNLHLYELRPDWAKRLECHGN